MQIHCRYRYRYVADTLERDVLVQELLKNKLYLVQKILINGLVFLLNWLLKISCNFAKVLLKPAYQSLHRWRSPKQIKEGVIQREQAWILPYMKVYCRSFTFTKENQHRTQKLLWVKHMQAHKANRKNNCQLSCIRK